MNPTQTDYPLIRANGRVQGNSPDFIARVIDRARSEHAPQTAVFKEIDTGRWITLGQLPIHIQDRIRKEAGE